MTNTHGHGTRAKAKKRQARRRALMPVRDAAIAFAAFALVALTAGSAPLMAGPSPGVTTNFALASQVQKAIAKDEAAAPVVQIATVSAHDEADAIYRRTSFGAAWVLLAASFSLTVALNLAMVRHLSRVYARRRQKGGTFSVGTGGKSGTNH
jgi:hypothetical protein